MRQPNTMQAVVLAIPAAAVLWLLGIRLAIAAGDFLRWWL